MPAYGYTCAECGSYKEVVRGIHEPAAPPSCCGAMMRRRFHSPALVSGLVTETHFNRAVGRVVHSSSEFRSELARKSDQMSERLGQTVDYQPLGPGEAPGVDVAAAKDAMRKRALDAGAERKFIA